MSPTTIKYKDYLNSFCLLLFPTVIGSFIECANYRWFEYYFNKDLFSITNLSIEKAKIEEEKIILSFKNYFEMIKMLFRLWIQEYSVNEQLIDARLFEKISTTEFTQKMYQNCAKIFISLRYTKKKILDFSIIESSKKILSSAVEQTIVTVLPSRKILLDYLASPVSKNELHKIKKKEIRKLLK